MKRRKLVALICGLAITWPLASNAQEPKRLLKRIGILASQVPCPLQSDNLIIRRLAELGWVEGQNFDFECVSAFGRFDQVPALARELVSRRPDVLMAVPTQFIVALKQETATIPIVMLIAFEPQRLGLITSLAQPGGNVTGVAWFGSSLLPKQMELLKEVVPTLRRVAYIRAANPVAPPEMVKVGTEILAITENTLGITWQVFSVAGPNDFGEIFARLAAEHFDAAYIVSDHLSNYPQTITRISELALRHRIPTVSDGTEFAKGGILLTYGQDGVWSVARGLEYVDKILRGAKPSDLPVEQAARVQLKVNLKTSKALGLTIPPTLLARADEIID